MRTGALEVGGRFSVLGVWRPKGSCSACQVPTASVIPVTGPMTVLSDSARLASGHDPLRRTR